MRHERSLDAGYFEKLYSGNADPWQFETSDYERAKYDATLAAFPKDQFDRAFEIGCANGVLTERLARYCRQLIAVDVVDRVLERARRRCAALANVSIRKASIPADLIGGPFDLIVLSEVAYYWDSADIRRAGAYFAGATADDGYLLLVHWTGETNYPKSGDEAVAELRQATMSAFTEVLAQRKPNYRLDLWQRRCG